MQNILEISLTSGIAIATVIILWRTLSTNNKQLFVSNFTAIINDISSDTSRECRAILYHYKDLIDKLEANPKINLMKLTAYNIKENIALVRNSPDLNIRLRALLEVIKYIAATYDRVGLLIGKDSKLQKQLMDHHGFVIGKMWIISENVIKQQTNWERGYKYFKQACDLAYSDPDIWKELEKFKRERIEKNTNNIS